MGEEASASFHFHQGNLCLSGFKTCSWSTYPVLSDLFLLQISTVNPHPWTHSFGSSPCWQEGSVRQWAASLVCFLSLCLLPSHSNQGMDLNLGQLYEVPMQISCSACKLGAGFSPPTTLMSVPREFSGIQSEIALYFTMTFASLTANRCLCTNSNSSRLEKIPDFTEDSTLHDNQVSQTLNALIKLG